MMSLKTLRYAALILSALSLGMGFCHLMELPARINWSADLWVGSTVEGGLYQMFGSLGAVIVVLNVIVLVTLAIRLYRHRIVVRWLAIFAALMYLLALVFWFILVAPANVQLATWLGGHVPPDWASWRLRWELGHAFNTVLQMLGFAALAWSVLEETPAEH
ncbi:MAG TPA: hypothetical protein VF194_08455 [Ferrovibrio sp.]|uniref:hypothetical protein n=1 Tax=Ferrovibrio sp. TaxID=1917215 RepID=UPI002ED5F12D